MHVQGGLQFEVSAVLVLLAVAVEHVQFLVRELQLSDDSRGAKVRVQDHGRADLAVLLDGQLLPRVLERRAPGVVANLQIPIALDHDLAVLIAFLVARAA